MISCYLFYCFTSTQKSNNILTPLQPTVCLSMFNKNPYSDYVMGLYDAYDSNSFLLQLQH